MRVVFSGRVIYYIASNTRLKVGRGGTNKVWHEARLILYCVVGGLVKFQVLCLCLG